MEYRDKNAFFRSKGLDRLKYLSSGSRWFFIISSCLGLLLLAWYALSLYRAIYSALLRLSSNLILSDALAGPLSSTSSAGNDFRPLISMGIMGAIGVAFIWSLAVCFHSDDEHRVKTASDLNKMLLGFLIGAGKSYLGV
jgi:hypothetical protein